jgi:hypothetical protein
MPTWEDLLEGYVGLAKHLICTTCLNAIFRGSTGHWGQKIILNKVAPAGGIKDNQGHQIVFQCHDCVGRDPVVAPIVHPNGEIVDHINISELADHQDKSEVKKEFGDYDNRKEMAEINKQYQPEQQTTTKVDSDKQLVKDTDANYKFSKDEEKPQNWEQLEASVSDRVDKDKLKAFTDRIRKANGEEEREAVDTVDKETDE